jgi:hypothetical protein
MNRFLTPLRVQKVGYDKEGRPLWRVLEELVYSSDNFGICEVPTGFITNFASVPRLPVIFLIAGDRAHEQATLHDYEYTVRRRSREDADAIFLEALQAETVIPAEYDKPVPGWMARMMYQAVRIGGQSSWEADSLVPQPQHVRVQINSAADLVAA